MLLFYVLVSSNFKGFGQHNCENTAMKAKLLTSNPIESVIAIHWTKWQLLTISYLTLQWKGNVGFNCITFQEFKMFLFMFAVCPPWCSLLSMTYFPLTKSELPFHRNNDRDRENRPIWWDRYCNTRHGKIWRPVYSELHLFFLVFHMDIRLRNLDFSTDYIFPSLI